MVIVQHEEVAADPGQTRVAIFHTDFQITEEADGIIDAILGVERREASKYKVLIEIGELFSWDAVSPEVIEALEEYRLSPEQERDEAIMTSMRSDTMKQPGVTRGA